MPTYGYDNTGNRTNTGYTTTLGNEMTNDGTWTYTYDPAGEQTSVTDPTGAQTQATYDMFGQMITSTQLVRQNPSAAYTTTYGYDDAGNQTSVTTPTGVATFVNSNNVTLGTATTAAGVATVTTTTLPVLPHDTRLTSLSGHREVKHR